MLRLQRIINGLPLLGILIIALAAAVHYLSPGSSDADASSRPPSLIPSDQQQSQIYIVIPGSIQNGNTLQVANGKGELEIRLCGIAVPGMDQPMGIEARDHLSRLIDRGDGTVMVVPVAKDRDQGTVAELFIQPSAGQGYPVGEEIALSAQMVLDGYAYVHNWENCPNGQVLVQLVMDRGRKSLE